MTEKPPIKELYSSVIIDGEDVKEYLMHYGMPRRSGRYPWGSGENPFQHSGDFLARVESMRKDPNFSYKDPKTGKIFKGDTGIAKALGLSTTEFRVQESLAKTERRDILVSQVEDLKSKGYNNTEIARKLGFNNESSIRSLLKEDSKARMKQAQATADILKKRVKEVGMIDVGKGVATELGVSDTKLDQALYLLYREGYEVYGGGVPQVTNKGQQTNRKVLCPPGTPYKDIYDYGKVHSAVEYTSHDGGETFDPVWVYPKSMDSKRLMINYAEDGGLAKDGLVEIRRNVADLDLGKSKYAQVRILVDGKRYIKGMAVYADDLPEGVDVRFNTNKSKDVPKMEVLKKIKEDDPTNPFGSLIKPGIDDPHTDEYGGGQSYYYDKNGKKQLSLINKRSEEGDWGSWNDKLSSQFLSKQDKTLIKRQLDITRDNSIAEFESIKALENPTVKKALLSSFANDCDSAAVHLKAAALPRQKYQVIIPMTTIKNNEIYAPNYKDGETVALVRYPHGGTFEIPILKVNNKLPEGKRTIGTNPLDAVGINSKVAAGLSGADFDGDTVMVIPCNSASSKVHITSTYKDRKIDPDLKSLEAFDPKFEYGAANIRETVGKNGKKEVHAYRGDGTEFKLMTKTGTQTEMGRVSNLITDMTLKGAPTKDIVKAVKHSMVVIDAEKHHLDYKKSEIDNDIQALKNKYQGHYNENGKWSTGAGTLISRASGEKDVPKRQGSPRINEKGKSYYDPSKPEGTLIYKNSDKLYYTVVENGKEITKMRTQKSTQMAETTDARTLSSGNPKEEIYADYANYMKKLAQEARMEQLRTGKIEYSASANKAYANEVSSLMAQLNMAKRNKPRERQAQSDANAIVKAMKEDNPEMSSKEIKKASQIALVNARKKYGAERTTINITPKEWEAIQAGAISENKLTMILNNTDIDKIREYATPRTTNGLTTAQQTRIRAMANNGYTNAEIANQMGISASTVSKYL